MDHKKIKEKLKGIEHLIPYSWRIKVLMTVHNSKLQKDALDSPVLIHGQEFLSFDEMEEEARLSVKMAEKKKIPLEEELALRNQRAKTLSSTPGSNVTRPKMEKNDYDTEIYEWHYPQNVTTLSSVNSKIFRMIDTDSDNIPMASTTLRSDFN